MQNLTDLAAWIAAQNTTVTYAERCRREAAKKELQERAAKWNAENPGYDHQDPFAQFN